ncbi:hypothetical protein BHE74_00038584 [Ensete ventricosum]|nr:hypothetical protein BHE74_00038584 [Ensete ventricosum]
MADFGDDEYKHMLCVEAAAIEKPITLKPGEEWKGRLELSTVPSSYRKAYSTVRCNYSKVCHTGPYRCIESILVWYGTRD